MAITLTGRVLDSSGNGINCVSVSAIPVGSATPTSTVSTATVGGEVGVYTLTGIADNTYKIDATYSGQVRELWGNARVQFGSVTIGANIASISTAGVLSATGGTFSTTGVKITAGNLAVGATANDAGTGIYISSPLTTNTTQYGVLSLGSYSSAATVAGYGVFSRVTTAASAFTMPAAAAYYASNANKGAGSAITNNYGLFIEAMTAGSAVNYGVFITAPSGGTTNIGLYNLGTTRLDGNLSFGVAPATHTLVWASGSVTSDGSTGGYLLSNRNGTITAAVNSDQLFGLAIQNAFGLASKTGVTCYGIDVSPSWTTSGINYGVRISTPTAAASSNYGLWVGAASGAASTNATFWCNGGDVVLAGSGSALGTGATSGFVWIPSMAGVATGSPANAVTGAVPFVYDSTNNKIGVRSGGTWRWTAALV